MPLGTWGEWVAGIATLLAVLVALRVNRREGQAKLEADDRAAVREAYESLSFTDHVDGHDNDGRFTITLGILNRGDRPFYGIDALMNYRGEVAEASTTKPSARGSPTNLQFVFHDVPLGPFSDRAFAVTFSNADGLNLRRNPNGRIMVVRKGEFLPSRIDQRLKRWRSERK